MGIRIGAHIASIYCIKDTAFDPLAPQLDQVYTDFPVLNSGYGEQMRQAIAQARSEGDSLGGIIECVITGLPAGLGEPMFGGMESRIAQIIYGVPAVKSLEFGIGAQATSLRGRQVNDPVTVVDG